MTTRQEKIDAILEEYGETVANAKVKAEARIDKATDDKEMIKSMREQSPVRKLSPPPEPDLPYFSSKDRKFCEACGEKRYPNTILCVKDNKIEYYLCPNCFPFFATCSMTPQQYKNILKYHDTSEFYLHGDFYDEDGRAVQPMLGR